MFLLAWGRQCLGCYLTIRQGLVISANLYVFLHRTEHIFSSEEGTCSLHTPANLSDQLLGSVLPFCVSRPGIGLPPNSPSFHLRPFNYAVALIHKVLRVAICYFTYLVRANHFCWLLYVPIEFRLSLPFRG